MECARLAEAGARRLLVRGTNPQSTASYFDRADRTLVAQPFDAAREQTSGQSVPLADRVEHFNAREAG